MRLAWLTSPQGCCGGGGDREARTLSKQVVWDQWTWVGTMTNAGFSFSSCSSSRGQRSCERLALRSYPDKEGKEAAKLFMDPAPWLGFCLLNTFRTVVPRYQGIDPFLLE